MVLMAFLGRLIVSLTLFIIFHFFIDLQNSSSHLKCTTAIFSEVAFKVVSLSS